MKDFVAPNFEQSAQEQQKMSPEADHLFNRVFSADLPKQSAVISTGQIESMNVPVGWDKRPPVRLPAGAGLVEYNPPGQPDVRLKSFYRGHPMSDEGARAFHECLSAPPHILKPEELRQLAETVRDKAHDFNGSAKTEDLNGKRVLILEGRYTDDKRTSSQTVYVNADGKGSAVQEISFTACDKDYSANLLKAQKSFKSIIWKMNMPGVSDRIP